MTYPWLTLSLLEFEDLFGSSQELIQSPSPLTPPPALNRPIAPSRKRLRMESDRNLPILSSPLISSQSVVSQIFSDNQPLQNLDALNIIRTIEPTDVHLDLPEYLADTEYLTACAALILQVK